MFYNIMSDKNRCNNIHFYRKSIRTVLFNVLITLVVNYKLLLFFWCCGNNVVSTSQHYYNNTLGNSYTSTSNESINKKKRWKVRRNNCSDMRWELKQPFVQSVIKSWITILHIRFLHCYKNSLIIVIGFPTVLVTALLQRSPREYEMNNYLYILYYYRLYTIHFDTHIYHTNMHIILLLPLGSILVLFLLVCLNSVKRSLL